MGRFLQDEKPNQINFKVHGPYFSDAAKTDGHYKKHPYPFCIPEEYAEENLYPEIRDPILAYFARNGIKWHDGHNRKPSNHLCDSQVCCANFLFPFADKPIALAALLSPIFPDIQEMMIIEDGQYIAFEWIGEKDYLEENRYNTGTRTRGANYTSADAAVLFKRKDNQKQIVLIEWKYTESYSPTCIKYSASKTDRTKRYERLYYADDSPVLKELLSDFDDLFYEPFYQFLRQQLLANEMEKAHEKSANIVSVLHISPEHNKDFMRVTSPGLKAIESSATRVWQKLLKNPDSFIGVYTEKIHSNFTSHLTL